MPRSRLFAIHGYADWLDLHQIRADRLALQVTLSENLLRKVRKQSVLKFNSPRISLKHRKSITKSTRSERVMNNRGYLQAFVNLRTDKNRKRWEARTCFRAPHKPFLLLSILDLVAQGLITRDFVEPSQVT